MFTLNMQVKFPLGRCRKVAVDTLLIPDLIVDGFHVDLETLSRGKPLSTTLALVLLQAHVDSLDVPFQGLFLAESLLANGALVRPDPFMNGA